MPSFANVHQNHTYRKRSKLDRCIVCGIFGIETLNCDTYLWCGSHTIMTNSKLHYKIDDVQHSYKCSIFNRLRRGFHVFMFCIICFSVLSFVAASIYSERHHYITTNKHTIMTDRYIWQVLHINNDNRI